MEEIRDLLSKISNILNEHNETEWSTILTSLRTESYSCESHFILSKIMELYGGTGYLNDIILEKDGELLINENAELYKLRQALYKKCLDSIVTR